MAELPEPLLSSAISLVLEYIAPPSLLSSLPRHLISTALAQRHAFLHISPDNPAHYLAWPTESRPDAQQTAIDLLESFQKQLDDPVYVIRYTSDAESTFAHVAISPQDPQGLRLVFQWNPPDGWKFHNLALMPFPPNSYESINNVVVYKPHDFLDEPVAVVQDDERDSYWDAYGLSDDVDDQSGFSRPKVDFEAGTEDAYWAQYSDVHGSGDSTRPTPPIDEQNPDGQRVIVSYPGHRTSSAYNPLEPPSPKTLAYRLANISPRAVSPLFVDDSDTTSGSESDGLASLTPSPTSHPMTLSSSSNDYPSSPLTVDTHAPSPHVSLAASLTARRPLEVDDEARAALKDTIRSVYRLWKAGRVIGSPTSDGDGAEFLEVVRQVVAESSL